MIGFTISLSGIHAGLRRLDVAADNIANSATPAFKRSRVHQSDLAAGGARVDGVRVDYSQGPLEVDDGRFSLAVDGDGFFRVQTPQGERFSRAGAFRVDAAGRVVTAQGYPLLPGFTLPPEAVGLEVNPQGQVTARLANGQTQALGAVDVVRFANPGGLAREGGSLLSAGPASGPAVPAAGSSIVFGAVEGSNVDLGDDMVSLIVSRASVKANLAALRTKDETLGEILDLQG
ncbi:MAG: flagellar hook basal-body protein [Planctomycetes bacterium]|nr:flagellar hook basal-body protein [Planctomycetota bacterium]